MKKSDPEKIWKNLKLVRNIWTKFPRRKKIIGKQNSLKKKVNIYLGITIILAIYHKIQYVGIFALAMFIPLIFT